MQGMDGTHGTHGTTRAERNGTRKTDGTERNEKSGTATQLEGWNVTDGTQYKLNTTDWNCNGAEDMK